MTKLNDLTPEQRAALDLPNPIWVAHKYDDKPVAEQQTADAAEIEAAQAFKKHAGISVELSSVGLVPADGNGAGPGYRFGFNVPFVRRSHVVVAMLPFATVPPDPQDAGRMAGYSARDWAEARIREGHGGAA